MLIRHTTPREKQRWWMSTIFCTIRLPSLKTSGSSRSRIRRNRKWISQRGWNNQGKYHHVEHGQGHVMSRHLGSPNNEVTIWMAIRMSRGRLLGSIIQPLPWCEGVGRGLRSICRCEPCTSYIYRAKAGKRKPRCCNLQANPPRELPGCHTTPRVHLPYRLERPQLRLVRQDEPRSLRGLQHLICRP